MDYVQHYVKIVDVARYQEFSILGSGYSYSNMDDLIEKLDNDSSSELSFYRGKKNEDIVDLDNLSMEEMMNIIKSLQEENKMLEENLIESQRNYGKLIDAKKKAIAVAKRCNTQYKKDNLEKKEATAKLQEYKDHHDRFEQEEIQKLK